MTVTVYSQPGCQPCKATIRMLSRLQIDYVVIDITTNIKAYDYIVALGFKQTPVVIADDEVWAGYSPDKIQRLRGL